MNQQTCSVPGCNAIAEYRTAVLCRRHYNLRRGCRRRHDEKCECWQTRIPHSAKPKTCTYGPCGAAVRCSGLCAIHYDRKIKGIPMDGAPEKHCIDCGSQIAGHNTNGRCQRCYQRVWKTRERHLINNCRNRANKYGAESLAITVKDARRLLDSPCNYCGTTEDIQVDHVVPLSKGGRNSIGNLAPCCASCNRSKRDMFVTQWKHQHG